MRTLTSLLFFLFCIGSLQAQLSVPPLERKISIDQKNKRAEDIFLAIAEKASFDYSYNPATYDRNKITSLTVTNVTVRRALDQLFENRLTYKVRGNHVMLLPAPAPLAVTPNPTKKVEYKISGYVTDKATGFVLPDVSVVDTARIIAVISDRYGFYSLAMPAGKNAVRLRVKRTGYFDTTIVVVPSSNFTADVALRRIPQAEAISKSQDAKNDTLIAFTTAPIDTSSAEFKRMRFEWANNMLSRAQRLQFINLKDDVFKGKSQVSLLPFVSTNGLLTGKTRNKFSFNIIAGYTGGTDVLEIGGLLNIDRGDVKNVQIAGGANVVIGNVEGVQTAGAFNIVSKQVYGMQIAGSGNVVLDSMEGVQLTGGVNMVNNYMLGVQGSGAVNGVVGNMFGAQVGGTGNMVLGNFRGIQIGGWGNYAKNASGFQLAGGINYVNDTLRKVQLAGAFNYADISEGIQISGAVNVCNTACSGLQISPLYNQTHTLNGTQIGIINNCKNYESGLIFGFLSFVTNGVHQLDISSDEHAFLTTSFRTGVPRFYNILIAGKGFQNDASIWSLGYGAGTRFNLNPQKTFRIALDYMIQHVNHEGWSDYTSEWHQLKPTVEWAPFEKFCVAMGPTFNWYQNRADRNWFAPYVGKPIFEKTQNGNQHRLWIGATLSVRFL